ncbi:hypothetical protein [Mucilaginibacter psychrotolerans]|uniref:hypothetical protein n=1 Tax=Mucilaginibacter psychrotolerans TaxID=1524096 RepID=UPI0013052914|nr:hypothetical protein [Mucilaginibacter psychrotolerans]
MTKYLMNVNNMADNNDKPKAADKPNDITSSAQTQKKPEFVPTPVMKVRAQLIPKKKS